MSTPEQTQKIAQRLKEELGDRLREFPLEVRLDQSEIFVVLRGAAGSVTALRGLREKLQPVMKKLLREHKLAPRFQTLDNSQGGDMHIKVEVS